MLPLVSAYSLPLNSTSTSLILPYLLISADLHKEPAYIPLVPLSFESLVFSFLLSPIFLQL